MVATDYGPDKHTVLQNQKVGRYRRNPWAWENHPSEVQWVSGG